MSSFTRSVLIPGFELSPQLQQEARRAFAHRFTGEHVPAWSRDAAPNGSFYAPQYVDDQEWLSKTLFPVTLSPSRNPAGEMRLTQGDNVHCESTKPSFPWGTWLDKPFVRGTPLPEAAHPKADSETGPSNQ